MKPEKGQPNGSNLYVNEYGELIVNGPFGKANICGFIDTPFGIAYILKPTLY